MISYSMMLHDRIRHGTVGYDMISVVLQDMIWYGTVRYDVIYGMI